MSPRRLPPNAGGCCASARSSARCRTTSLKKYERPELCYCAGWSRGREKFRGQLDVAKGSWYANGLHSHIDDASLRERYPESTTEPQWPSPDLLGDSLEDAFRDLSRDLHALSRHVLRRCDAVAERALRKRGVAYETTLSDVVDRSRLHVGRLLHYFPRDASGTWCGWHNDNSIITALAPALFYDAAGSEVPAPPGAGLTALSRSGAEHRVAPPRGSVLFQIGEAAQILTAGALMATPHAVQAGELASCSREAFALFVEPAWDEPLDVPRAARAPTRSWTTAARSRRSPAPAALPARRVRPVLADSALSDCAGCATPTVLLRLLGDRRVDLRTEFGRLGQLGAVRVLLVGQVVAGPRLPRGRLDADRVGLPGGRARSTRIGDRPAPPSRAACFAASAAGRVGCAVAGRACFRGAFRFAESPRG